MSVIIKLEARGSELGFTVKADNYPLHGKVVHCSATTCCGRGYKSSNSMLKDSDTSYKSRSSKTQSYIPLSRRMAQD